VAKQVMQQVQATAFDPGSLRMSHDQRAELRKLGPVQLRALHQALISHVQQRPGKPISQTLTEEWYQQNSLLRENRQAYKRCWESHRHQGDTRPHMHWFKAVLMHRLNEWLRETRQPFIWGFDNQTVWQLDLAYPASLLEPPEGVVPLLEAAPLPTDVGAVHMGEDMAGRSGQGDDEPQSKRARVGGDPVIGLKCKASPPVPALGSSASGLTSTERIRAGPPAAPKPMPRSGAAKATIAPGGQ
jgi:hypothetical protein